MNTIKCTNCGQENKNTNIRCTSCSTELNHIEQNDDFKTKIKTIDLGSKKVKYIVNAILVLLLVPWFLIGLGFIGVSAYSNITDYNKSKNYIETEGKLVSYKDCQYDEDGGELCTAVYEYTVKGATYKGSPNLLSNRSRFKQTATVKYNPNDPSEYVMNSGWNVLLMVGIIMVAVVLIIFISVKIFIKKCSKKEKNMGKDMQVIRTP